MRNRWMVVPVVLLALLVMSACSRPTKVARTTPVEPWTEAENDARPIVASKRCSGRWSLLFPGLGHACYGEYGAAAGFASLAAGEIYGTVATARHFDIDPLDPQPGDNPAPALLLTGLQDLWIYSALDTVFLDQRASGTLYAPPDTPEDLIAAPFNWQVLKRPEVWGGLAAALAVGIGVSLAIDKPDTSDAGKDPNLFGTTVDGSWGYPAGFGVGTALFTHVAMAEEALFRGYIQSGLARSWGENSSWVVSSLLFGAVHALNLPAIDKEDRKEYVLFGLPVITAAGFYLGWVYKRDQYSLAAPVAVHFWYDLLLTMTFFAIDPQNSPLSAGITLPF